MYYFTVLLAVLASSHILVRTHYVRKRTHPDIDNNFGDCDKSYHARGIIIDDEPLEYKMRSGEYIQIPTRNKAAKVKRLRKSKKPLNPHLDDENDRHDTINVNRNVNKNLNSNVNKHKNRPKELKKKPLIPTNQLEIIEISDSDELVDNLSRDRNVRFETANPQKDESGKRIDRHPNRYSTWGNVSSALKRNVSLEVEDSEPVIISSTPKSSVELSSTASVIDDENSSDDSETLNPMENEDLLEDIREKQEEHRLWLKKQRNPKEKHQLQSNIRGKIIKKQVEMKMSDMNKLRLGKQRIEKGEKVKNELSNDSGSGSESPLNSEDGEEYAVNNVTTKSPLVKDNDDIGEDLDERNQTIPSLRRMFPKFKALRRIRGPQWSGSDLLMYAIDSARKSNSDTVATNRILQDTIDPKYLPDRFKPTKRTKNLNKYKRFRKIKQGDKNKYVDIIDGVPIVPLTPRPFLNKYKARSTDTINPLRTNDENNDVNDDDDDEDNDDFDDKRPTKMTTNLKTVNENVNRNVNVNVNTNANTNDQQDASEKSDEQINIIKYMSNRRAFDENLNSEDTEPIKHEKITKNINTNLNKNDNINRNKNRRRPEQRELTQKELDNLLKKYEDEENQNYGRQSAEYYY